jgi:hypothetical protein
MTTIEELNTKCFEYLSDVCVHKRWQDHRDINGGGDEWYNSIIIEVFKPEGPDFWKWLGEDEHFLSMQGTAKALVVIRLHHEQLVGDAVTTQMYENITSEMIISLYANLYVCNARSLAVKCITDAYDKLDRSSDINTFNESLIESMSADPEFSKWVEDEKFMVGVGTSLGLAEACVEDGITVGNIRYDFDNREIQ